MSKLLKLKEWISLSLDQAVKYLSNILEEAVTVADLYQLALNKQITLSVNLVNQVDAKIGKVLPYSQIPKVEMPALGGNGTVLITKDTQLNKTEIVNPDGSPVDTEAPFIYFEEEIYSIDGIWDLAMIGAEVIDIEFWLNQKINAPTVDLINLVGTFVKKGNIYASLQSRFEKQFERKNSTMSQAKRIFPCWTATRKFYVSY